MDKEISEMLQKILVEHYSEVMPQTTEMISDLINSGKETPKSIHRGLKRRYGITETTQHLTLVAQWFYNRRGTAV